MKNFKHIKNLLLVAAGLIATSLTTNAQIGVGSESGIKVANSTTTEAGNIRFDGTDFEGYDGSSWLSLTEGSLWTQSGADIYFMGGDVGVGTNTPAYPIDLHGTITPLSITSANLNSNQIFMFVNSSTATADRSFFAQQMDQFRFGNNRWGNNFDWWATDSGGSGRVVMTLDAEDGNLGLGTATPSEKIQIISDADETIEIEVSGASSDAELRLENTGTFFDYLIMQKHGPSSGGTYADGTALAGASSVLAGVGANKFVTGTLGSGDPVHIMSNSNTRIYIEGDGDVGINNTMPTQKLHMDVTGTDGFRIDGDGTGDARIWITNTGGGNFIFDDSSDGNTFKIESANDLAFNTGGTTERMRIDDNGEIGVNVAPNTNYRFQVFTDNDLYGIFANQDGTGTAYGIGASTLSNGAQTKYGVNGVISGSTGTGNSYGVRGSASTSQASFWAVYAAGDLWYTGSIKAPSDQRLKKNIQDLDPVLDKVMQLQTKTYEFDREKYDYANLANGPQVGFIAQNVQELFPTLVEEERHVFSMGIDNETGNEIEKELNILGMSQTEMVPILTKAIQEQQNIINQQQAQIDELLAKYDELAAKVEGK